MSSALSATYPEIFGSGKHGGSKI